MRADTSNYRDLFLDNVPMMDARAPVEFAKGAFPGVVNLPLMTDEERELVGICYKQRGQQAAIELGHRLVGGAVKRPVSTPGPRSRRRIRTATCIASGAACVRRSCSNGCATRPASPIRA